MRLYKDGALIPEVETPTFRDYAENWFVPGKCDYLAWRELHDPLSASSIMIFHNCLDKHLREYFGPYRLDEISTDCIEKWQKSKVQEHLKGATINLSLRTLRMILDEAVKNGILKTNPTIGVKKVKTEEAKRSILTLSEVKRLFGISWDTVWEDWSAYKVNLLAASTGMRISELRGLKKDVIFSDFIFVKGQYIRHGYVDHTKTKHARNVPISPVIRQELDELIQRNGDGYVFSDNDGVTPIAQEKIERQLYKALEKIGIDDKERRERNLTFHAWRHFFNTLLRMSDIADSKVQSVTGHLTRKMTEHYTHFDTRQFAEVRNVQAELLTGSTVEDEPDDQRII
jgi:integrase